MPLNLIIRDILKIADNSREVRQLLATREVLVDGSIETDPRRGVGLMDVLSVGGDHFRCLLDNRGKLRFRSISAKEAGWKLCRVDGKTTVPGGKTQLNLHDGRNILIDDALTHNTQDTLHISLPDQKIMNSFSYAEGASAYLIGGSHVGTVAEVVERITKRSSLPNEVRFEDFSTISDHLFIISESTPLPGIEVSS